MREQLIEFVRGSSEDIRGIRLTHNADFVDFAITSLSDQPLTCLLVLTYFYINLFVIVIKTNANPADSP